MPTALVVDDSRVDQRLAGSLLENRVHVDVVYADNGGAALEAMRQRRPDLVVTDLQMPQMNGLEVVEAVRRDFPDVPVILMTAHGSEEVAAEALRRGATSYVPKRNLSRDLARTAEQVLALVGVERQQAEAMRFLDRTESHFVLDNETSHIHPVIRYVHQDVARLRLCDETSLMRIDVALDEALSNAMIHGNLEVDPTLRELAGNDYPSLLRQRRTQRPYRDRRVELDVRLSHREAVFVVRDEGRGFDVSSLPDPRDPSNIERMQGRGLLLIRTFMDEVRHNQRGNEITLIKHREPRADGESGDESAGGRRQPDGAKAAGASSDRVGL